MGFIVKSLVGFSLAVLVALGAILFALFNPKVPPVPKLEDTWWGPGRPTKEAASIRPFKINVSDEVLKDLQHRLDTSIPFHPPLEGAKQNYGMNTNLLKEIVTFWRTKYNWREREKFLNQFPQFTVNVQGLRIHYIHVKPQNTKAVKVIPMLLLHGWPGSVREFYETIPLLTTPQKGRDFVFEVVIPSLPGYGFSEAAVRPGLGGGQMAVVFKNFMERIGFDKYYVQGGDWGAFIVKYMAILYPEKIIGLHSNMCYSFSAHGFFKTVLSSYYPSLLCTKEEEQYVYPLLDKYAFQILEMGYFHLQATKPDTVGVSLRESPVGLAAYILEKFTTWTNPEWKNLEDGGLTKKFDMTDLLDNVMIYWVTRSITTSMRLYSEHFNKAQWSLQLEDLPVNVPSGCARFTKEIAFMPEAILTDTYKKLMHITINDGGHFAAFEVPRVMAEDIFEFVEKVEKVAKEQKQ